MKKPTHVIELSLHKDFKHTNKFFSSLSTQTRPKNCIASYPNTVQLIEWRNCKVWQQITTHQSIPAVLTKTFRDKPV